MLVRCNRLFRFIGYIFAIMFPQLIVWVVSKTCSIFYKAVVVNLAFTSLFDNHNGLILLFLIPLAIALCLILIKSKWITKPLRIFFLHSLRCCKIFRVSCVCCTCIIRTYGCSIKLIIVVTIVKIVITAISIMIVMIID